MTQRNAQSRSRTDAMLRSAFGSVICDALAEPSVVEIMQNPNGELWIERAGVGRRSRGQVLKPEKAERIIRLIASLSGFDVTREPAYRERRASNRRATFRGGHAACGFAAIICHSRTCCARF